MLLAPPSGKISNLKIEILNNFAEDTTFISGQVPKIFAKGKFNAH